MFSEWVLDCPCVLVKRFDMKFVHYDWMNNVLCHLLKKKSLRLIKVMKMNIHVPNIMEIHQIFIMIFQPEPKWTEQLTTEHIRPLTWKKMDSYIALSYLRSVT